MPRPTHDPIAKYNKTLKTWCNWEVEIHHAEHDQSESYAVYRIEKSTGERFFMGCIPTETPVGALMCCASLCQHYYALGRASIEPLEQGATHPQA